MRERSVEIAAHLVNELDRGRDVDRLDVDLQQWPVADPGFVFDLDGVVAQPDDQIGGTQELALDLPARPLDAAERERMILVDHPLGHGRGRERKVVALDHPAQQLRIAHAHRRRAENRNRPSGGMRAALPPGRSPASAAAASLAGCAGAGTGSRWWRQAPRPPADRDAPDPSARSAPAVSLASASRRCVRARAAAWPW